MGTPVIRSQCRGGGRPVVLLHAFPLSHELWNQITPPPGFEFILPDFPGFGLTPLAGPGLSISEAALGLEAHLKQLGLKERFILGGISMGGYWALEFMRQFPERVEAIALISTRAGVDTPEGRKKRLDVAEKVEKEGTEGLIAGMLPGLLGKTTIQNKGDIVTRVGQWIREASPQGVALAQRAMSDRREQKDLLPQIKVKSLIMAGREDALIPVSEAEAMARLIPGSRLEIHERVGHLIPLELPKEFESSLHAFLSQVR